MLMLKKGGKIDNLDFTDLKMDKNSVIFINKCFESPGQGSIWVNFP